MLFVSTTLNSMNIDDLHSELKEVEHDRIMYRRLDPEYYAWLRYRMGVAEKAMRDGMLKTSAFNQTRVRFNSLHEWAVKQYGKPSLLDSIHRLNPDDYQPPKLKRIFHGNEQQSSALSAPHLYPDDGDWSFTRSINHETIKLVDAIRDKALSLGWSEPRLYQNRGRFRFPCGQDYGLVCFLHDGQTIGEVSEKHIEIVCVRNNRNVLRFYNPDVDQPWIRKIGPDGSERKLGNVSSRSMTPSPITGNDNEYF